MLAITPEQAFQIAAAHQDTGRLADAAAICRRVLAQQPDHAGALHLLGKLAGISGRYDEARELISGAIAASPRRAPFHSDLGVTLQRLGREEEAIASFQRALEFDPNCADAHYNLGHAWQWQGRRDLAITAYREAIRAMPAMAEAHNNLAGLLQDAGDLDGAFIEFSEALRLRPDYAAAYCTNLGNVSWERAEIDAAMELYRRSVALEPHNAANHSNLVHALHFHPADDPAALAHEHTTWNRQHAEPLKPLTRAHGNDRSPERRLRIGYLSPNFRGHVIGRNVLPLLRAHDRSSVEVFCYSDTIAPDGITRGFRESAAVWRDTRQTGDDALAEQVRADGVDILVDLAQHLPGNRLPVFARKPAPVQVSFAAYPGGAGLDAIDAHLTDPHLGGDGGVEIESFWCFDPLDETPPVNPLPAHSIGHVTFGCLNKFAKVNDRVLALWDRVLREVPGARLLILSPHGSHRERVLARLDRTRVEFTPKLPRAEYLAFHGRLDVMLDTFPYNGHTTMLDALWMGVPAVSLAGRTPVSRGGLSILTNLGLPELAARSEDDYVRIAVGLARDLPRLATLRDGLRERMKASLLMDPARFARNVEAAYRAMWRRWCMQDR